MDRFWTIAYFDHFGLPASGMEFTVTDFAFRSLEALIVIGVAALIAGVAWVHQEGLKTGGFLVALLELAIAVALGGWIYLELYPLPEYGSSFLATTSVLGLIGGAALGSALWLTVDVWAGPGRRQETRHRFAATGLAWLLRKLGLEGVSPALAMLVAWRIVAFGMLLVVTFLYLPDLSERLARLEAEADVKTGRFAAAILESDINLPLAIASSADPMRSAPVRVILVQKQNTHVLHSTDCTTIGDLEDPVSLAGFLPPDAPEVCKVLSIAASHITSIEYFPVKGHVAVNQSALRPIEISLSERTTAKIFDSGGASDEERLKCLRPGLTVPIDQEQEERDTDFLRSLWYAFEAPSDGAVLVRVETDEEVHPSVAVWAAPAVDSVDLEAVQGSGFATGIACEVRFSVATNDSGGDQGGTKNVVGVVANVNGDTRYLASVGATNEKKGAGVVSFQFVPGARFLHPLHANDMDQEAPHVSVPPVQAAPQEQSSQTPGDDLTVARVQLELWRLDSCQRLNRGPTQIDRLFFLVQDRASDIGTGAPPTAAGDDADPEIATFVPGPQPGRNDVGSCERDEPLGEATVTATPTSLPIATETATPTANQTPTETPVGTPPATATPTQTLTPAPHPPDGLAAPAVYFASVTSGRWLLQAPTAFRGLVRLSTIVSPDVSLRFTIADGSPLGRDACMQREIRAALEQEPIAREIGYDGVIIVELASEFECTDDDFSLQDALDALDAQDESPSVYIEVVGDFDVLSRAAAVVARRLEELSVELTTEQCGEICISVIFAANGEP